MRQIIAGLLWLAAAASAGAQFNREAEEASIRTQARILDDPATTPEDRGETLNGLRNGFCAFAPPMWRYAFAYKSVAALQEDPELGPLATQFLGELQIGLSAIIPNSEKRKRLAKTGCRPSHWIPRPPQDAEARKKWVRARVRDLDDLSTSPDDRYSILITLRDSFCAPASPFQSYTAALKSVRNLRNDQRLAPPARLFLRELQIGIGTGRTASQKQALLAETGCAFAPAP